MLAGDLAHQREPEARAAGVAFIGGTLKGEEHALLIGGRNTGPVIAHGQHGTPRKQPHAQRNRGPAMALRVVQ